MDLLSFFALGIIVFVFLTLACGIVAIHDIPYNMPKRAITRIKMPSMQRGWVSLVYSACHLAIFVDMATVYRPDRGYGFSSSPPAAVPPVSSPPATVSASEAQKKNKKEA